MRRYAQQAGACLMLSTMLHSIAVGNMLPASVRTVCADINPAVVTSLPDRGSFQAIGIVTDVGLFVEQLADELVRQIVALRGRLRQCCGRQRLSQSGTPLPSESSVECRATWQLRCQAS